jgi:hypoxanthine phosphoribosyltransferase
VYDGDIASTLVTEDDIRAKTAELAVRIGDYAERGAALRPALVGVLKGAVMFMTDLARALPLPVQLEFMAVSSYGSATSSSGVVRILKDLDRDIAGRHVLIVEDIIDSGPDAVLAAQEPGVAQPASLAVCTLLRKPDAVQVDVPVRTSASTSPTSSSSGYGWTTRSATGTCRSSGTLEPRGLRLSVFRRSSQATRAVGESFLTLAGAGQPARRVSRVGGAAVGRLAGGTPGGLA